MSRVSLRQTSVGGAGLVVLLLLATQAPVAQAGALTDEAAAPRDRVLDAADGAAGQVDRCLEVHCSLRDIVVIPCEGLIDDPSAKKALECLNEGPPLPPICQRDDDGGPYELCTILCGVRCRGPGYASDTDAHVIVTTALGFAPPVPEP